MRGSHFARAGANAKRSGASFEAEVQATNDSYRGRGLVVMARAHPPTGGIPGSMFFKGKAQVDFVGLVRGVPVAFDTKVESGAASYKHDADEMHQIDFLIDWRVAGGVAFLLLLDRKRDALYLIEDLAGLRVGASVPLRTHERSRSRSEPLVPVLYRTESERTLDAALGRPVWPWLDLVRQVDERLQLLDGRP